MIGNSIREYIHRLLIKAFGISESPIKYKSQVFITLHAAIASSKDIVVLVVGDYPAVRR